MPIFLNRAPCVPRWLARIALAAVALGLAPVAMVRAQPSVASGDTATKSLLAQVILHGLSQAYDGTEKPVEVVTAPAGLPVRVTYDGATTPPIFPGRYRVSAAVASDGYSGMTTDTLVISATAVVHGTLRCEGSIDGSVQMASGKAVLLDGRAWISGDLLVPGSPNLDLAGFPMIAGSVDDIGAVAPADYTIALRGDAVLRYLVRRVDPPAIAPVASPTVPTTGVDVTVSRAGAAAIDSTGTRDVRIEAAGARVAIAPGAYRALRVDAPAEIILGERGALVPSVYRFASIAIRAGGALRVVGPVVIIATDGVWVEGDVGDAAHARWLTVALAEGDLNVRDGSTFAGMVLAPAGAVTIGRGARLTGTIVCDQLYVAAQGTLVDAAR